MGEKKSGFGFFRDGNKWTPFKNKPVNVNFSGTNYCGIVKEIDVGNYHTFSFAHIESISVFVLERTSAQQ